MDSESHVTEPATVSALASEGTTIDTLENVEVGYVEESVKVVPDPLN